MPDPPVLPAAIPRATLAPGFTLIELNAKT